MNMRTHAPALVAAFIFFGALAGRPDPVHAQGSGTYSVSGDRVAIYNLAGTFRVEAGSGSDVEVSVTLEGADAEALRVETGAIRGVETLRVIYPDDDIVYRERGQRSRTQMRVNDDGTFFGDRGRGRRVTIRGSGRGVEASADLVVSVPAGKSVGIYLGVGDVEVRNVSGDLLVDVASASIVAEGTSGVLSLDTGSGSVEVAGAEGEVDIDTGSGSVEVSQVRGESLHVDTGSGSVEASQVDVRDLDIDTGSGRITVRDAILTDGVLDTGSGSVRIELLSDVDDLTIDTGSGSVTVVFPEDLGAELYLESSSGGIDFDVPIAVREFDRQSLRGEIGDGRGRIQIDTGSGTIRFIQR